MYELLLYGEVPQARHEQLLKILAGVAAMQPQRVLERHLIYKPVREPPEPEGSLKRGGAQTVTQKQVKAVAQKDLFYSRIVQTLDDDDFKPKEHQPKPRQSKVSRAKRQQVGKWAFQFHDVPNAGDRGVLVRLTSSTDIAGGRAKAYIKALGNNFVSEYYQEGHRFVYGNINLLLHRVLQEPGVRALETSPKGKLPDFDALKPLDPSGGYLLQATIRVQDLNNPALLDAGVAELQKFKGLMKGCVELLAPDRLVLDTRVKFQKKPVGPGTAAPSGAVR
jgi:mediator of RNA polymerase II transcription subunit 18